MEIFKPTIQDQATFSGSVDISGSLTITQNLTVNGELLGAAQTASYITLENVDGFADVSSSIEQRLSSQELFSSSLDTTLLTLSGSFSGSFVGDGSQLSGVTSYTDEDTLAYINSIGVLSGSAQIASDISGSLGPNAGLIRSLTAESISGSFTSVSQSLAGRVTPLEGSVSSLNAATSSYALKTGISGSFTALSSSFSQRISTNESDIDSLTANTSSYLLNTTDTLTGDLTVTGKITAQEFHTEFVSASIIYESGSTKFGNSADDVHNFTGNVGIGETNPGAPVHIKYSNTSTPNKEGLRIVNSSTDNEGRIAIGGTSGAGQAYVGEIGYDGESLHFYNERVFPGQNASSPALTIDQNSNVGVGTASPSKLLHVHGEGMVRSNFYVSGSSGTIHLGSNTGTQGNSELRSHHNLNIISGVTTGTLGLVYIRPNNTLAAAFNGSGESVFYNKTTFTGNVGIGTTSPGVRLTTRSGTNALPATSGTTQSGGALRVEGGDNAVIDLGTNSVNTWIQATDKTSLGTSYFLNLNPRGGNVGIGTTTPTARFDVRGAAGDGAELLRLESSGDVSNGGYHWMTSAMATSQTTDASMIHLIGVAESTRNSGYFGFHYTGAGSTNNYLKLGGYSADNLMVIKMDGNVGIGTTGPNAKLDVNGQVNVQGSYYSIDGLSVAALGTPFGYEYAGGNLVVDPVSLTFQFSSQDILYGSITQGYIPAKGTTGMADSPLYTDFVGNVGIGITSPAEVLEVNGQLYLNGSQVWSETTQGLTRGTLHIDPASGTDNAGGAITWGASDAANGTNGQAGIYVRSDGAYGTKMYFSTTDSYAQGAKTKMFIGHDGKVGIGTTSPGGNLTVQGLTAGATVLDIQGTSGQLFSVTDDLTGTIFAASDISGIPILEVDASGTVTVDGTLTVGDMEVSPDLGISDVGSILLCRRYDFANVNASFGTVSGNVLFPAGTNSFEFDQSVVLSGVWRARGFQGMGDGSTGTVYQRIY